MLEFDKVDLIIDIVVLIIAIYCIIDMKAMFTIATNKAISKKLEEEKRKGENKNSHNGK